PARVWRGNIEWPSESDPAGNALPAMMRPRGIEHHYAPLGFVEWDGENVILQTCRCEFAPSVHCTREVKAVTPDLSMKDSDGLQDEGQHSSGWRPMRGG